MLKLEDVNQFKDLCSDMSVLMVDDEAIITDAYKDVACRFFTKVEISNDPSEVLKNYAPEKYDIIYTDLNMPVMNGIELIRAIKKINDKQKFIVISASDEPEKLLDLISLNVSSFIVKPFNINKFINASLDQVSILIQSRLMEQEVSKTQDELIRVKKEKEEQQQMLIQQSKLAQTGEMISMISHQWRQPLSSITTIIAGLKTRLELGVYDTKDNPLEAISFDLNKAFEKIETSASFLSKTVNDFRNFYRPDNVKNIFNVCDTLENVVEMLSINQDEISFELHCPQKENTIVNTFESELKQVFMSIINNAIDAIREKNINNAKIHIEVNILNDILTIHIIDNAGGIPSNIIDNIFLPYFSTKSEKNGTGLGLHMAKTIVEEHILGSISVQNSKEYGGAEFRISIPIQQSKG